MYKNYIVKPLKDGLYEGIGFEGKPYKIRKYEYFPALTLQELNKKEIYLILKPTRFFFENYTISLPVYSPEIIRLKLQDRVNTLGYFNRSVDIYWRITEKRDSLYKIAYLALESEVIGEEITKLKELGETKLEAVTFLPFVLAQIISQEPGDKILIHREREGLWILLMNNGNIHLIEFFPIDELLGLNIEDLKGRLSFLQNFYYRDTQKNLETLYLTTEKLLEIVKDFNLQVKLIKTDYPDFLGIFRVESDFNFLPAEERAIKKVLEGNYKASLVMLLLSVFLVGSSVGLHLINKGIEKENQQKEHLINESLQKLFSQYPEDKLRTFRSYLEERINLQRSPDPESLLVTIIQTFNGTKITNLEIKREGETYSLNLKGEKRLSLRDVSTFTSELQQKINSIVIITENKIDYSALDNKIIFEIKGKFRSP